MTEARVIPRIEEDREYAASHATLEEAQIEYDAALAAYRDLDTRSDDAKRAIVDYVDHEGAMISEPEWRKRRTANGADPARPRTAIELASVRIRRAESAKAGAMQRMLRVTQDASGRLAREWLRDTHAVMEEYIVSEAAQLEHVAVRVNSYDTAARAGAATGVMGPLPQSAIVRLREFKADVRALAGRGVRIDTKALPEAVRAYLEG
jgi:hypothetical protein